MSEYEQQRSEKVPAIGLDHLTVTPGDADASIESASESYETGGNYEEPL